MDIRWVTPKYDANRGKHYHEDSVQTVLVDSTADAAPTAIAFQPPRLGTYWLVDRVSIVGEALEVALYTNNTDAENFIDANFEVTAPDRYSFTRSASPYLLELGPQESLVVAIDANTAETVVVRVWYRLRHECPSPEEIALAFYPETPPETKPDADVAEPPSEAPEKAQSSPDASEQPVNPPNTPEGWRPPLDPGQDYPDPTAF